MAMAPEDQGQATTPRQAEVIMAGIGGKGVLLAGQVLAEAASTIHRHVAWFPSYSAAVRGGPCECTTIFSDGPIASPLLWQAQTVVVMVASQLGAYEGRVRPGGLLVVETAGLPEPPPRDDCTVLPVPALEIADRLGALQAANLVLLGAYIGATDVLRPSLIQEALERRRGRWGDALAGNLEAFRRGLEVGAGGRLSAP